MTATERYIRRRQLEAVVLTRRARAVGGKLEARVGLTPQTMTPDELLAAMARGFCHWHRTFWRVVCGRS